MDTLLANRIKGFTNTAAVTVRRTTHCPFAGIADESEFLLNLAMPPAAVSELNDKGELNIAESLDASETL